MFIPGRVIFEEQALEYDLGKKLFKDFENSSSEIKIIKNGRVSGIPGKDQRELYMESKNTLVVGIRKTLKFESCKPSAHFQLPLVSGCMGMCEYCYLNTQMGKKPYIKIHVNLDEILEKAKEYAEERGSDITIFEGAATSDPIPVEHFTGALRKTAEFFGERENTLFRFVTKFTDVDNLIGAKHNGRTTIRFSINTDDVIKKFEHRTPSVKERINAARKVSESGYKLGFIIAPVFMWDNWKEAYLEVIEMIKENVNVKDIKFEVISHRFTKRAKETILSIYPKSLLPMEEEIRKFKFGQFGYGKYVYTTEQLKDMKDFFQDNLIKSFGEDCINYII